MVVGDNSSTKFPCLPFALEKTQPNRIKTHLKSNFKMFEKTKIHQIKSKAINNFLYFLFIFRSICEHFMFRFMCQESVQESLCVCVCVHTTHNLLFIQRRESTFFSCDYYKRVSSIVFSSASCLNAN